MPESLPSEANERRSFWAVWSVIAAFGTYFCMYGFRKPFTAAAYKGTPFAGVDFKTVVVTTQVLGYMLSKFIGIKVVSELSPRKRAAAILVLIGTAQLGLLAFAFIPRPWNAAGLFLNGLSLGMVYGLVVGFLEGRQLTEALVAGLCASFILADGVTKSVGIWLLNSGVSEEWMPFAAGMVFLLPLCISVAMLTRIPPPTEDDIAQRAERPAMTRSERWALLHRHAVGLSALFMIYLLVTIIRSIRADFAPELWRQLGAPAEASTYTQSETLVAIGVLMVNGAVVCVKPNRKAFTLGLLTCGLGYVLLVGTLILQANGSLSAFTWMVVTGFGLYLPYVALHTTIFERVLAMTRERGNLGFLMYIADAFGYLAYVVLMFSRNWLPDPANHLQFFTTLCWIIAGVSLCGLVVSFLAFKSVSSPYKTRCETLLTV